MRSNPLPCGRPAREEVADYISCLLIGSELLDAATNGGYDPAAGKLIAGSETLNNRY